MSEEQDHHAALPSLPLTQLIPGLPPQYDYEAGIAEALAGHGYRDIAKAMGTSRQGLRNLRQEYAPLNDVLARARANGLDELFDDLRYIVDDHTEMDHRKLKVAFESTKYYLACSNPRLYGDRMNLVIEEKVDLRGSLEQARARVLIQVNKAATQADQEKAPADAA